MNYSVTVLMKVFIGLESERVLSLFLEGEIPFRF